MKTIVVSKTGMSFCARSEAGLNAIGGEQGETEGLMRHLVARGDVRVVYFGPSRGLIRLDAGRPVAQHKAMTHDDPGWGVCHWACTPHVSGLDESSDQGAVQEGWDWDESELYPVLHGAVACINVCGPPATFSYPGNPKGSTVQLQGMKYTAPILRMLEQLRLPRVCVNNDPRTYPRDQEMSHGWRYARPQALLDQCENKVDMVVGGTPYLRHSYYSGAESWAYLPKRAEMTEEQKTRFESRQRRREKSEGELGSEKRMLEGLVGLPDGSTPGVVVAHAHIADGCRQRKRSTSWWNVLGDSSTWPEWLRIYGQGWEAFAQGVDAIRGPVTTAVVQELFRTSRCTPCVAAAPGFYTGKPYVAMSQGCVPVLYGDGNDPYTWDPRGELAPLDASMARCVKPGGWFKLCEWMQDDAIWRGLQEQWRHSLQPRWRVLDEVVDRLLDGTFRDQMYGGYRREV